jgi:hypothetical protein
MKKELGRRQKKRAKSGAEISLNIEKAFSTIFHNLME